MRVLLVDVDGKCPIIPLMKLARHYEDSTLLRLGYSGYPRSSKLTVVRTDGYDRVFVSILFKVNRNKVLYTKRDRVVVGGTGADLSVRLPEEIECLEPDYSIYPDNETAYGFLTRGCVRRCPFCVVPEKEGRIRIEKSAEDTLDEVLRPQFKRVVFLDNNVLGHPDHERILGAIVRRQKREVFRVNFNQGLDIRLVTERNLRLIAGLSYFDRYVFAFDNPREREVIERKYDLVSRHLSKPWCMQFYILVGFNTSIAEDVMRIRWCKERKIYPYVMRHEKCWESEHRNFYTDMAAWCNRDLLKEVPLRAFLAKRGISEERRDRTIRMYEEVE